MHSAQTVLPTLNDEPALAEVRTELGGLLPGIAEKFADAAAKSRSIEETKSNVEHYRQAMQLIDEPLYLPTSVKSPLTSQLAAMQEKIDAAVREIEQDGRLHESIAAIEVSTKKQDFVKAYQTHRELLELYPRLRSNESLQQAVAAISAKMAGHVRAVDTSFSPLTDEHTSAIVAEIALAKSEGPQTIPELAKHLVPVVVDGVLYVLSAADGNLLWRRFVGREVPSAQLVGDPHDVVVADARRQELLRLHGVDGKMVWRLPLGESFMTGPITADQMWVTLPSGKFLLIDALSGVVQEHIEFPQRLAAAASLSSDGNSIFQLGDHSNLFVLDATSMKCRAVYYLGHKTGEIQLPPQMVGPLLIAAQQAGRNRTLLHALLWNDNNASLGAIHPPIALDSRLDQPLLTDRNRAIAIDGHGAIRVLEVDDASDEPSLAVIAEKSSVNDSVAAHAAIADGLLVVGDQRLAGYRVQSARGTLPPEWANHDGDLFVAPLHMDGEFVFHAHRQKDQAGVIVTAARLVSKDKQVAGQPIWQTRIALEPAGAVNEIADDNFIAWCKSGDGFVIDPTATGLLAVNASEHTGQKSALHSSASWRGGTIEVGDFSQLSFVHDDRNDSETAAAASVFPFQPTLRPGQRFDWLRPAVIDDQRFIAADRTGGVFVIHVDAAARRTSAALTQTELQVSLVAGPTIVDRYAHFIERGDDFDSVVPLALDDLQPAESLALAGRVVWGPEVCGDVSLLAIEPGGLVAVRAPASQVWTCDLSSERPAGSPLAVDDQLLIATKAGRLLTLSRTTGQIQHEIHFAQPLASGPAMVDDRVAVRTADGEVLIAEVAK